MNASSTAARKLLVAVAYVLSVPVYCLYELLVRTINRRPVALSAETELVVKPYFTDLDLDDVRLRAPATLLSGRAGLTLGHRIFVTRRLDPNSPDDMALLIHELVHVRQRMRFGRFAMMHRYGVEWARQLSYHNHPMEIEARQLQRMAHENLIANDGGLDDER